MYSRIRLWGVALIIALLISALTPFAAGVSRGAQPPISSLHSRTSLVVISPPPGLGLPAGQHVGVGYRFTGEAPAILALSADGITLARDWAQPGQAVIRAWTPTTLGLHQLRVRALASDGTVLDGAGLTVVGLPAGSRVRVPSFRVHNLSLKVLRMEGAAADDLRR